MADIRQSRSELRREALRVARGLSEGDSALVAVLRELEQERGRATETVRAVVRALAVTLQARDGYTGEHADAVHDLSVMVGVRLGLDGAQMAELAAVALLHDVGKIGIPDGVLHKPGPLDEAEWDLMREHPVIGERILSSVPGLEAVAHAVRHEHERWDGGGYPDGLRGRQIPLSSRIVLTCDAWHALVSDRPYRRRTAARGGDRGAAPLLRDAVRPGRRQRAARRGPRPRPCRDRPPGPRHAADRRRPEPSLERELVALISVASAVAAAHRLDDVLDVAAEESRLAIEAASLSIERWLPERGMLRTLVNVGELAPGEEHHPGRRDLPPRGGPGAAPVLQDGGTYHCSVDDPDAPAIERDLLAALGKHSSVAVPIRFGGDTWGQIWAARTADQPPFGERDARFLHAISGQIGSAIGRAEVFSRVTELAQTDGLTGLLNRRAFDEALEFALLEARGDGHDLSLVLCDVDNLKEINDHDGHEAGDVALRAVARALEQAVDGSGARDDLPHRRRRVLRPARAHRRDPRTRDRRRADAPSRPRPHRDRRLVRRRRAARRARTPGGPAARRGRRAVCGKARRSRPGGGRRSGRRRPPGRRTTPSSPSVARCATPGWSTSAAADRRPRRPRRPASATPTRSSASRRAAADRRRRRRERVGGRVRGERRRTARRRRRRAPRAARGARAPRALGDGARPRRAAHRRRRGRLRAS